MKVQTRTCPVLLIVVVSLLTCGATVLAADATSTWIEGAGGNWNDAANWDSVDYPDNGNGGMATYDAVIDLGGAYTVSLTTNVTVEDFTLDSASAMVQLSGNKTLAVNGIADLLDGTFVLSGGTLQGGTWNQNGGTLLFNNNNTIDGATVNGLLDLSANNAYVKFLNGGTFTGDADITGAGADLYMQQTGTLNGPGQTITIGTAASIAYLGVTGAGNTLTLGANLTVDVYGSFIQSGSLATVVNQGRINIHQVTGNRQSYIYPQNQFTNESAVEVLAGAKLYLGYGTTHDWTNTATGTIRATDATVSFYGGWENAGTIEVADTVLNLGGAFTTAGMGLSRLTRSGGTVNLVGTLDNTGDTLTLNAATGDWSLANSTIKGGTVNQNTAGAKLVFSSNNTIDGATVNGVLEFSANSSYARFLNGGTFTGDAEVTGAGAHLYVGSATTLNEAGQTITVGTSDNLAYFGPYGAGSVLTLGRDLTVDLHGAIIGSGAGGSTTVVNQGRINIHPVTGARWSYIYPNDQFTNENTVDVLAGAKLYLGYRTTNDWANTATGTIRATDATVSFYGGWENAGTIEVADTVLNLGGAFTTAGMGLSRLTRSGGTVNLVGTLDNTGEALTLDAATGDWTMNGGTIKGGTVNQNTAGAKLVFSSNNTIDGATVNGVLEFSANSSYARFLNGGTFTGDAEVTGAGAHLYVGSATTLNEAGQTITVGTSDNLAYFGPYGAGSVLTLGRDLTVDLHGAIIGSGAGGSTTVVNQGRINIHPVTGARWSYIHPNDQFANEDTVDVLAGAKLQLGYGTTHDWTNTATGTIRAIGAEVRFHGGWDNAGTIEVTDTTLDLGGAFTTAGMGLSRLTRSGGTVNLVGTLDNTGDTLTLNAATGDWTMKGGTVRGGTVNQNTAGAKLLFGANNTIDGATVNGVLDLSANSSYVRFLNGGTFTGDAEVTGAGAHLYVGSATTLNEAGQTITVGTSDNLAYFGPYGAGSVLTLGPDMTVDLYGSIIGSGAGGSTTVVNQGRINIHPVTGARWSYIYPNDQFTNENTVDVLAGAKLYLGHSTTHDWVNAATGTIRATDATLSFYGGWENAGTIEVADTTLNLGGAFTTAGMGLPRLTRTGGTVNLVGTLDNTGEALTLDAATGDWTMSGGTIKGGTVNQNTAGAKLLFNNNNTIDGATVNGVLDLSANNAYVRFINGATFTGNAEVTGAGADLYVGPAATLNEAGQTITLGAPASVAYFGPYGAGSALTLGPNVTVDLYGSIIGSGAGGSTTVVNQGRINIHPVTGARWSYIYPNDQFTNENTVDVLAGAKLYLGHSTTHDWANTATGTIRATDAAVSFSGPGINDGAIEGTNSTLDFHGACDSNGTIDLAGGTLVPTALTNAATGEIAGYGEVTAPLVNHGAVRAVGGALTFDGGIQGGDGTVRADVGATLAVHADSTAGTVSSAGTLGIGSMDTAATLSAGQAVTLTDGSTLRLSAISAAVSKLAGADSVAIGPNANLDITVHGGGSEFQAGTYELINAATGLSGTFANVTDLKAYVSVNGNGVTYDPPAGTVTLTLDMNLNPGDGNLDGVTDVLDRIIWNSNNFTFDTTFRTGDYNNDGATDVLDRIIWNSSNFTFATGGPPGPIAAEAAGPPSGTPKFIYDFTTGVMRVEANGHFLTEIVVNGNEGASLLSMVPFQNTRGGFILWTAQNFNGKFQAYDAASNGDSGNYDLAEFALGLDENDFIEGVDWGSVPEIGQPGGSGTSPVTIVPEPATMALLAVVGMGLLVRRRRRR